jgi:hypothetical protein
MKQHCYELAIRVLVCKEVGKFVAHALELDLVAEGDTGKEACKELHETILAQLSFAAHMEKPEMVSHAAPKDYFDRWDEANRLALAGIVCPEKAATLTTKAIFICITPEEMKAIRRKKGTGFARIPERELATA